MTLDDLVKPGFQARHRSFQLIEFRLGQSPAISLSQSGRAVTATLIDQTAKAIATGPATLVTGHAQDIEPACQIAEDDCAVAGHDGIIARPALDGRFVG
jgi:hypothetical protein